MYVKEIKNTVLRFRNGGRDGGRRRGRVRGAPEALCVSICADSRLGTEVCVNMSQL